MVYLWIFNIRFSAPSFEILTIVVWTSLIIQNPTNFRKYALVGCLSTIKEQWRIEVYKCEDETNTAAELKLNEIKTARTTIYKSRKVKRENSFPDIIGYYDDEIKVKVSTEYLSVSLSHILYMASTMPFCRCLAPAQTNIFMSELCECMYSSSHTRILYTKICKWKRDQGSKTQRHQKAKHGMAYLSKAE